MCTGTYIYVHEKPPTHSVLIWATPCCISLAHLSPWYLTHRAGTTKVCVWVTRFAMPFPVLVFARGVAD